MKCPVCKTPSLDVAYLEPELPCQTCRTCGGHWVKWIHYWQWHEAQGKTPPERPAPPEPAKPAAPTSDSTKSKLCPDCGHLLTRRKVGHGVGFALDHCGNCGGTWFDRAEWESLRQHNLHMQMHLVFTDEWQAEVFQEQQKRSYEQLMLEKFGEKDLAELRRVKTWLAGHAKAAEARAFLMDAQEEV